VKDSNFMPDGCVLKIHLKPNADNDGIVEIRRDFLKIKVNALPEKGKANERLIKFLARVLSISRESVFIISGTTSSKKAVKINSLSYDAVIERLKNAS